MRLSKTIANKRIVKLNSQPLMSHEATKAHRTLPKHVNIVSLALYHRHSKSGHRAYTEKAQQQAIEYELRRRFAENLSGSDVLHAYNIFIGTLKGFRTEPKGGYHGRH